MLAPDGGAAGGRGRPVLGGAPEAETSLLWRAVPAVLVGAIAGVSAAFALGGLGYVAGAVLLLVLVLRSSDIGATVVGAYWAAFAIKSTVFSDVVIQGLFYPFYVAIAVAVLAVLIRRGLTVSPLIFWSIFAFFIALFGSFVGYDKPVDGEFVQNVVAILVCPLVFLAVQSRGGLNTLIVLALAAGTFVSGWVIVSSLESGFVYRGDVGIDQNIVAFVVGISLVVVLALVFAPGPRLGRGAYVGLVLGGGTMTYALLLLASRGMTIALAGAVVVLAGAALKRDPRFAYTLLLTVALGASLLLLPGSDGLMQRFQGESVDSAGDRAPIWAATVQAIGEGNLKELLVGHGFESSSEVVRQATATTTSTHNAYLAWLHDLGLVGLVLFLLLHAGVLVKAARDGSAYGLAAEGVICFLLVANLTITATDDFMYWLALGFAMASVNVPSVAASVVVPEDRPRHEVPARAGL